MQQPQAAPAMDVRPNHTIYINNLNEKIKKEGESVGIYLRIVFRCRCVVVDKVQSTIMIINDDNNPCSLSLPLVGRQ
jgi:hypothetical protein